MNLARTLRRLIALPFFSEWDEQTCSISWHAVAQICTSILGFGLRLVEYGLMQKLIQGISLFQESVFTTKQRLFEGLAEGQKPLALFITCSDSRVDPNLLTQTEPGELFVLRNAGNIIPPYGVADGGEAATIEYAVEVLRVTDIIVCGHSHCGAMASLLKQPIPDSLPAVRSWLGHAESARRIVCCREGLEGQQPAQLDAVIQQNALVQLTHLRTHPSVAAAYARRELSLHAWVYKFESGHVLSYSAADREYRPIARLRQIA
jgi:carbonic anhydrase